MKEVNNTMKNLSTTKVIIIAVVVAAVGFFGGMQYQKSQVPQGFGQGQLGMMRNGGNNGAGGPGAIGRRGIYGMRPVAGQIIGKDSNSVTVKMPDGSSKIVILSSQTKVVQTATASLNDLTTGQTIAVFGTPNSDGSVTAQNIMLNPQIRGQAPSTSPVPTK